MSKLNVINLEDAALADAIVLVWHQGQPIGLTRERLHELLRNEQHLFELMVGGGAATRGDPGASVLPIGAPTSLDRRTAKERAAAVEPVTHASLSYRIKRIFDHSLKKRRLRAVHAGILSEMIDGFDWKLPDHPATKLELHLREIQTWPGVDPQLKEQIAVFMERYLNARSSDR